MDAMSYKCNRDNEDCAGTVNLTRVQKETQDAYYLPALVPLCDAHADAYAEEERRERMYGPSDAIKSEEVGTLGLRVEAHYDEMAAADADPRQWDNLGKLSLFHQNYNLPDEGDYNPANYESWDEMVQDMREKGVALVFPVMGFPDNRGLSCWIVDHVDQEDFENRMIGVIYVEETVLADEYDSGAEDANKERAEEVLRQEIETYNQWGQGEVYGYVVRDVDDEVLDSRWGFIGDPDEAMKEGKRIAEGIEEGKIKEEERKMEKRTVWQLARLADCSEPDNAGSPGADFLGSVQDATLEAIRWAREHDEMMDLDAVHEIADGCVPVYTHEAWQTFVDLGAYEEEDETGSMADAASSGDLTRIAMMALYQTAHRLVTELVDEAAEIEDEEIEA